MTSDNKSKKKERITPAKRLRLKVGSQKVPGGTAWLQSDLNICVRDVDLGALILFSP